MDNTSDRRGQPPSQTWLKRSYARTFPIYRPRDERKRPPITCLLQRRMRDFRLDYELAVVTKADGQGRIHVAIIFTYEGMFAPDLLHFVSAVEIRGVRYERVPNRDLDKWGEAEEERLYLAEMMVAIDDSQVAPPERSRSVQLIFVQNPVSWPSPHGRTRNGTFDFVEESVS